MKRLLLIILTFFLFYHEESVAFIPADLFPRIDKWNLKIEKTVYTPDNLWELINGAADVYLVYSFQDLHIGEYSNENNNIIRVELYRHKNSDNTFGIYTIERMPDYNFINVGVEGYTSFGALNFFSGNYYVKMVWSGSGDADEVLMKEIALKVNNQLNQLYKWPDELMFFPAANKLPKSEGYSSENFLGYSFLSSAFSAGYDVDNNEFRLFVMKKNSMAEAVAILEKYFKIIKFTYSTIEEKDYIVDDPYNGKVGIGIKGNFIYGIINTGDIQLIKKSMAELQEGIKI